MNRSLAIASRRWITGNEKFGLKEWRYQLGLQTPWIKSPTSGFGWNFNPSRLEIVEAN